MSQTVIFNQTPERKELVSTSPGRAVLVGSLEPTGREIYGVSPSILVNRPLSYDETWDVYLDTFETYPMITPENKRFDVFAIYLDGTQPIEYRLVFHEKQNDYYLGKIIEPPFGSIRYVYEGKMIAEPKLLLTVPEFYQDNEMVTIDILKEAKRTNKAVFLDINHKTPGTAIKVEIYGVYGHEQSGRLPIEYRFVFTEERMNFYRSLAISLERNEELLQRESSDVDSGFCDERTLSDGLKIVTIKQ